MQTITVNLNLSRGSCRINQPLYLGETVTLSFSESGDYSLILTEPFADSPKDGIAVWAQSIEGKLALTRKALHNAFKKADALQPNMTISAKVFVQDESGATVADGEVTIEYSPKAFVIDDEDYPLAREVLAQAEAAKNSAVSAKTAAEEAKLKAKGAQSAAEEARDKAQRARNEAQEAKTGAEKALSAAKESAATSSAAKEGAITAQNASEAARTAAQNAQEAAEEARDDAETIASDTATKLVEASEKRLQDQILNKVDKEPFNALAQKVDTVVGGDTGKSARTIAAEEVAKVVANAPADLDTLKEIADYIESDKTGAAQMVTQIDANAKAISAEAARAKDSEAALDGRVTELENDEVGITELMIETTHSDLVTLRDNGALIPGMQYRITDYVATTVQEHTQSANHPFDIIVTADSANKLNEVARAIRHNGDTYFPATTKFEAWKIWYSLDNDTNHFAWADSANGKGVIYRMIDEFNNDVPYDFKGIKMQAYLGYDEETGENKFSEDHRYTFGIDVDDTLQGNSRENVIKSFDFDGRLSIVRNTFGSYCNNNFLDVNCNDNTFGSKCDRNILGAYCIINKFGNYCKENRIGFDGYGNTFGSNCRSNTFNVRCNDNTLSDSCGSNVFGTLCTYNTLGSNCFANTLGSECYANTFGSDCFANTLGSECYANTFGPDCSYNTFGSNCGNNTLYAFFSEIILQNSVAENTIDCTADRGEYEYCKNIEIKSGVIGKGINIDDVEQSYHTEIRPENSITISI